MKRLNELINEKLQLSKNSMVVPKNGFYTCDQFITLIKTKYNLNELNDDDLLETIEKLITNNFDEEFRHLKPNIEGFQKLDPNEEDYEITDIFEWSKKLMKEFKMTFDSYHNCYMIYKSESKKIQLVYSSYWGVDHDYNLIYIMNHKDNICEIYDAILE